MSLVHIYTTPGQPLTKWRIPESVMEGPSRWNRCSPRAKGFCYTCGRTRWAKNLRIQVYYDHSHIFCAEPDAHVTTRVPYSVWSKRSRA